MNSEPVSAAGVGAGLTETDPEEEICVISGSEVGSAARAGSEDGVCVTGKVGVEVSYKTDSGDGNGVTSGVGVGSAETLCAALESGSNSGSVYSAGEDEGSERVS